jgi:predicted CoA-binding protein
VSKGITVVLGASPNPARVAFRAANMLKNEGLPFELVGIKKGEVAGKEIQDLRLKPEIENVDTLTLYIGPDNQIEWYDYMFSLKPRRIIFNPGTENQELIKMAKEKGIECEIACTLVLLSIGNY